MPLRLSSRSTTGLRHELRRGGTVPMRAAEVRLVQRAADRLSSQLALGGVDGRHVVCATRLLQV